MWRRCKRRAFAARAYTREEFEKELEAALLADTPQRAYGVQVVHNHFQLCGQLSSTADFMGIGVINAIDVQICGNQIIDSPIAIDCELHPGVDDALLNIQIHGNMIRTGQSYPTCWGVSLLGQPGRPVRWVSLKNNHPARAECVVALHGTCGRDGVGGEYGVVVRCA